MTDRRKEPRPRILLVKPVVPWPPTQGTKIVSAWLIRSLQDRFDVTVLTRLICSEDERAVEALRKMGVRVVAVDAPSRRSPIHRVIYRIGYALLSMFGKRSLKTLYDCPGATVRAARALVAEDFDVVVIEYWQMYPLFTLFPPDRRVLLTHDIDQDVNRQNALLERRIGRKLLLVRRWKEQRREETAAYMASKSVLTLTERDADAVRRLSPGTRVTVLPFGVPPGEPTLRARDSRSVLFLGAMSAGFNRDAAVFFAREIYPHLVDAGVDIRFVGGGLPAEAEFLRRCAGVEITGRVDDVRPWLDRAACTVVPLRYGGGLRIRILEAMGAGVPVVCTPVAIAGMPFVEGEHYLCGRSGDELAGHIRRLVDNPTEGLEIARAARRRVESEYGERNARERLLGVFSTYSKQIS